jgi:hypothetical protein
LFHVEAIGCDWIWLFGEIMRCMVPELRCDPDGLRALAAACEEHAIGVSVNDPPAVPVAPHQSTVAAVTGVHAATSGAADKLAERIRSTATALTSAAEQYARTDQASTAGLSASMPVDTR